MAAGDITGRKRHLSGDGLVDLQHDSQRQGSGKPPKVKRLRTDGEEKSAHISRPGVPTPADLYAFKVADRKSPAPRGVDKDGHFEYELGDNIGSRYKILSLMGEGTFGRVLECWDRMSKDVVAIKVIRNIRKYREAAMIELEVLNTLAANDVEDVFHCIHLQLWFDYRGHVCMVFKRLGSSLYDFVRRNGYRPFPLDVVMHFSRQILQAVAFMHRLTIVHTDLKPENILLCKNDYVKLEHGKGSRLGRRIPLSTDLKVIDLGSATFEDQYHSSIVSTRHYRAPEVILGLGWSYPCDVWSVGCIIMELLTGKALFQTHDNLEHLAMMERVIGAIPRRMASSASRETSVYFNNKHALVWPGFASSRRSVRSVQHLLPLKRMLRQEGDTSIHQHLDTLHDLLDHLLRFEPWKRFSAHSGLQHHFFRENIRSLIPHATTAHKSTDKPAAESRKHRHSEARASGSDDEHEGKRSKAASQTQATSDDADQGRRGDSSVPAETSRRSTAPDNVGTGDARAAPKREDARYDKNITSEDKPAKVLRRQGSPVDIDVSLVKPPWVGVAVCDAGRHQAAVS